MSQEPTPLNDCGCCEGPRPLTPASVENAPGLPALRYRVGTHGSFKTTMQTGLSTNPVLRALTTRAEDDPTLALIDSCAVVLDILTFYQERIANEAYVRTASERRSLMEMARFIGYEPAPGLAATVDLAFTLDDPPPATAGAAAASMVPTAIRVPVGTKAQSIPGPDEKPQMFETIEEIPARSAWNRFRLRAQATQEFEISGSSLRFAGTTGEVHRFYARGAASNLKPGDLLLFVIGGGAHTLTRRVLRLRFEADLDRTVVELDSNSGETLPQLIPPTAPDPLPTFNPRAPKIPFNGANAVAWILNRRWRESDLQVFLERNGWKESELADWLKGRAAATASASASGSAVFVMRERVGFFGHNAPTRASLRINATTFLYATDWDGGWEIWRRYPENTYFTANPSLGVDVFLERALPSLTAGGWAVFERIGGASPSVFRVTGVRESSLTAFGMSGKASGLALAQANGAALTTKDAAFTVRGSTAHVQSERLDLAPLPFDEAVSAQSGSITLEGMVLGLRVGQRLSLTGEVLNATGVRNTEILVISEILHHQGFTTLILATGLTRGYRRSTLVLNGNVARATHGETRHEVLGAGDGTARWLNFVLRQPPLTYVSAPVPGGRASTLEVRVNDLRWTESNSFFRQAADARTYVTRQTDDQKTVVQFGDGITGARPPTGQENIKAVYRTGSGSQGRVRAGQVSLLLSRPLGLKEVINPLPASGGADPETLEAMRENAPVTVRALGRVVSLADFEDFSRTFAGIAKALAVWLWDGQARIVHVTVAGADGSPVEAGSDLYRHLLDAIRSSQAPGTRVRLGTYEPLSFSVAGKILVTADQEADRVRERVAVALREAFGFGRRAFAQAVTRSEVLAVMQGVEGVLAVDLDRLHLSGHPPNLQDRLPARGADWNEAHSAIRSAELLLIDPREIRLTEMKS
ncbi:MAG: putative baseplate assembly protein [Verrucomicrobiales bacterium]|nr:putative baseplate assembly protein [Verrucomicrobiales bacterium]